MITLIHQPEYMPWMGFFDKMSKSDVFVIYDNVQFERNGFQNRNRIRTSDGWKWLTVPVMHKYPQLIKDVQVSGTKWRDDHIKSIYFSYSNAPYFDEYFGRISDAINHGDSLLADLNIRLIETIADMLGIKPRLVRSSEIQYEGSEKNEKLVSICKALGSDAYLSGRGGQAYCDEKSFANAGLKLLWHEYSHPVYDQKFGRFEPFMSVLDIIFNHGPASKDIILKGGVINENTGNRSAS
jgi:hypothetical protein